MTNQDMYISELDLSIDYIDEDGKNQTMLSSFKHLKKAHPELKSLQLHVGYPIRKFQSLVNLIQLFGPVLKGLDIGRIDSSEGLDQLQAGKMSIFSLLMKSK